MSLEITIEILALFMYAACMVLSLCIGGRRVLELGVPKIYVGSSKCVKANSRGVWGHAPPGKI